MATSPAASVSRVSHVSQARLTTRGRLLLCASGLVVALSLISANTALGSNESGAVLGGSAGYESIRVLPGESLWSIARQIAPDFGVSTGDIVAMIIEINNLPSSELESGAELLIPLRS
ncbi:MAG: LysM peptidoglycan-binding domain-containing protein [Actinomycetota bacterium]